MCPTLRISQPGYKCVWTRGHVTMVGGEFSLEFEESCLLSQQLYKVGAWLCDITAGIMNDVIRDTVKNHNKQPGTNIINIINMD